MRDQPPLPASHSLLAWLRPQAIHAPMPSTARLPPGLLAPVLCLLFVVVSGLPAELAMDRAGLLDADNNPRDAVALACYLLVPSALLGALVLAWTRRFEHRPLASLGLSSGGGLRGFLLGHATGMAMATAIVIAIFSVGGYETGAVAPAFASPRALAGMALLLIGFAVQSGVEELLFRGWLLSVLAHRFNPLLAVVLSTAVFALLHAVHRQPPVVIAGTLLFSIFASAWALSSRRIWGVMGWHAGWNWLFGVGFGVPITGIDAHLPALLIEMRPVGPDRITGGVAGPEGSLFSAMLLAIGTLVLLRRVH